MAAHGHTLSRLHHRACVSRACAAAGLYTNLRVGTPSTSVSNECVVFFGAEQRGRITFSLSRG
eukprot:3112811-Prymnesium_polylepis.1